MDKDQTKSNENKEALAETSKEQNNKDIELNTNAKDYVPKSKQSTDMTTPKLNLEAAAYAPQAPQGNDEEVEDNEEDEGEQMDALMDDMINDEMQNELDEDESDDEKWYPKHKDCECCKGFVFKCQGTTCASMGECFCKMKEDMDDDN